MPLFAGILWLATVLGALLTAAFKWFIDFAARRFGLVLLAIAAIASATIGFFAAVNSVINQLVTVAPPELATACGMVLPTNTAACISAIFATVIARLTYGWAVRFAMLKAG